MTAYYNEKEPFAAKWLENLIAAGHIAPGDVDTRDLWDVSPWDLDGYTQVHLCAGIGIWSHVLRACGWQDGAPVWTASFPCQPFSEAGQGLGFADERHLWPAGYHLIRERQPDIILGEQSASPLGLAWLELVQADLEVAAYAVGAVVTPAAGFGKTPGRSYHARHRQYWCATRKLGNAYSARSQGRVVSGNGADQRSVGARGVVSTLPDSNGAGRLRWAHDENEGRRLGVSGPDGEVDIIQCTDGVYRPVESGTFPLAHEDPERVGQLRAYGNALDAEQAKAFVQAVMECIP